MDAWRVKRDKLDVGGVKTHSTGLSTLMQFFLISQLSGIAFEQLCKLLWLNSPMNIPCSVNFSNSSSFIQVYFHSLNFPLLQLWSSLLLLLPFLSSPVCLAIDLFSLSLRGKFSAEIPTHISLASPPVTLICRNTHKFRKTRGKIYWYLHKWTGKITHTILIDHPFSALQHTQSINDCFKSP